MYGVVISDANIIFEIQILNSGNKPDISFYIRVQILTRESSQTKSSRLIMKSLTSLFFVGLVMTFTPDAFSSALAGPWNDWKRNIFSDIGMADGQASDIQVSLLCKYQFNNHLMGTFSKVDI